MSRSYRPSHGGGLGRSTRLMTVTVRPGKPNAAASSFLPALTTTPARMVAALARVAHQ